MAKKLFYKACMGYKRNCKKLNDGGYNYFIIRGRGVIIFPDKGE
jgi:hypothetical protein